MCLLFACVFGSLDVEKRMKLKFYSKLSAQVLFGCLLTTSMAQTGKRFILYTTALSWNEAAKVCQDNGGILAELDMYSSTYLLQDFQKNSMKINNYVWIGLTDVALLDNSLGTRGFSWSSCKPASWSNWGQAQPLLTWANWCAKLDNSDGYRWVMEKCSSQVFFLCEQTIGLCEFTTVISTCDLRLLTTQDADILSPSDCLDKCQSYSGTNGTRCWAYQLLTLLQLCRLYLGQTPVHCESGGQPVSSDNTQIRTCYAVTYNQTQNPPVTRNTDDRPKNCTPPNNSSQVTTLQVSTASWTTGVVMLDSSTTTKPLGSTADLTTDPTRLQSTITTPEPKTTTAITTATPIYAVPTSSSLSPPLTATSDTNTAVVATTAASPAAAAVSLSSTLYTVDPKPSSTTAASGRAPARKTTACGCVCVKPIALSRPQVLGNAQQLQAALTLNKSSLSSSRRRKESAPDHRPSAQATGGLGIAMLVISLLIIVLPDIQSALSCLWRPRPSRDNNIKASI